MKLGHSNTKVLEEGVVESPYLALDES